MKTKPPLVPWAVGHVGLVKAPEKPRRCGLCGTDEQNLWGASVGGMPVCTPCYKQANDRFSVANPVYTCCVCGSRASGSLSGWSAVPSFNVDGYVYCPAPYCREQSETRFSQMGQRSVKV